MDLSLNDLTKKVQDTSKLGLCVTTPTFQNQSETDILEEQLRKFKLRNPTTVFVEMF